MLQRYVYDKNCTCPVLTGTFAFIFYLFCVSPTITYGGDSGELIAASWTGGIPHPTGYSLYATLGWVFAHLLAFGEVAWRYNVFSALMGSIAVALVAAIVLRLTRQPLAAIVAGLSLAGSYFFASQSVIAEVYALNGALIALLLYAAIRWKIDRQWIWLAIVAFGVGLIPNSHMSSIFVVPGLLVFLWPRHPKVLFRRYAKQLAGLSLLVFLGFSLTFYLPWRAAQFPAPQAGPGGTLIYQPGDWGHPVTLRNWWNHVSARQYRYILWDKQEVQLGNTSVQIPTASHSFPNVTLQMWKWFSSVALQYLWLIALTLIGAFFSWKAFPRLGWLLWLIFGINLFVQVNYKANEINYIANLLFPSYIVIALWTGLGYHALSKVLLGWNPRPHNLGRFALRIFAVTAILAQWLLVFPAINRRSNTRARDTALQRVDAVQTLQNETGKIAHVLMVTDDTLFPFWYAQRVLDKVPETKTPWGPYRRYYWENGRTMEIVNKLQDQGPVAVAEWNAEINARYPLIPLNIDGTLWLASHRELPQPAKVLLEAHAKAPNLQLPSDIKTDELFAATLDFSFDRTSSSHVIKRDLQNQSIQIGWIKVMYLPLKVPFEESNDVQRFPLVIPAGLNHAARLQMTLPLQIPRVFQQNACEIWISVGDDVWQRVVTTPSVR